MTCVWHPVDFVVSFCVFEQIVFVYFYSIFNRICQKYKRLPVVGFLLTSLCLAGTVCHKSVRLIANPLRLRPRRVRAGEGEKGEIGSKKRKGSKVFFHRQMGVVGESGHFVITLTHGMTNGPLRINYPFILCQKHALKGNLC